MLQALVGAALLQANAAPPLHPPPWLSMPVSGRAAHATMRIQVITDIDDTIKSSGGLALANIPLGGVDTSYARGSYYPGVFHFAAALAAASFLGPPAPVAVLTARAEEFKIFLEIKQSDRLCLGFKDAGASRGLIDWGVGPVLYGSVQEWIFQERKGWRKFENFKKLYAQNAEAEGGAGPLGRATRGSLQYVFIGDNGSSEKDLEAAERIIAEFPDALSAVFLHAVSGDEQPAPLPEDGDCDGVPVRYFRTYATAAAKACSLGLIGAGGARKVLDAIEADLGAGKHSASGSCPTGSPNEMLLRREIAAARGQIGGGAAVAAAAGRGTLGVLGRPLRLLRLGKKRPRRKNNDGASDR